jgi:hypothetical protein
MRRPLLNRAIRPAGLAVGTLALLPGAAAASPADTAYAAGIGLLVLIGAPLVLVAVTAVKLLVLRLYTRRLDTPVRRSRLRWTCLLMTVLSVPVGLIVFSVYDGVSRNTGEEIIALGFLGLGVAGMVAFEAIGYRTFVPELGTRRCGIASALANAPIFVAVAATWMKFGDHIM